MIEGKCPGCGNQYYGWALANPAHQTCDSCGRRLEIFRDGAPVATDYLPPAAVKYRVVSQQTEETDQDYFNMLNLLFHTRME